MSQSLRICGGYPLKGEVYLSGSKNAALPILCTALLTDDEVCFHNVPQLSDIFSLLNEMRLAGAKIQWIAPHSIVICCRNINPEHPLFSHENNLRASILLMGPYLTRYGKICLSMPGGCQIGTRPIDQHMMSFQKMGVQLFIENGQIIGYRNSSFLIGASITHSISSVTSTENVLLAATLAKGQTTLINAAQEPEVVMLSKCLKNMGARISYLAPSVIAVEGVSRLHGSTHFIPSDRIEAATFLCAAAITHGSVWIPNAPHDQLDSILRILKNTGCEIKSNTKGVYIKGTKNLEAIQLITNPYPDFPTDAQPLFLSLATQAKGISTLKETVFTNRFRHTSYLKSMGAQFWIKNNKAFVLGPTPLEGCDVHATDLRAAAGLMLAALCARGETTLNNIQHLDRGYEAIEVKLLQLGALVKRQASPVVA